MTSLIVKKNWKALALICLCSLGKAATPAFIAVGENGTILSSDDGRNWINSEPTTDRRLRSVASKGGVLVIVGESGTILRSTDGYNWSPVVSGVSVSLRGVCTTSSGFLAVGGRENGVMISSPNGLVWTNVPIPNTAPLRSVAANNESIVAVGDGGTLLFKAVNEGDDDHNDNYSRKTSASDWAVTRFSSRDRLEYVLWTGTHYWVFNSSGKLYSSSSLREWQSDKITPIPSIEGIAWSRDILVAIGLSGRIQTTTDGRRWITAPPVTDQGLHGVVWTGDPKRARALPELAKRD